MMDGNFDLSVKIQHPLVQFMSDIKMLQDSD